ncbi:hypothetical protein [Sphingobacterium sp.]|uniref:hypothetical protein n=1 Tax=Sphingobacterium sp. TaxID=341027 RepID=UPI0031D3B7D8
MYTNKSKRLVLGEGETIGHKHVLECSKAISYEKSDDNIRLFLSGIGILTHDEHDRIVLKSGKYRSYNQVEFNPMDETVNRVFD